MGICPIFAANKQPQTKSKQPNTDTQLKSTDRHLIRISQDKNTVNNVQQKQNLAKDEPGIQRKTTMNQSVYSPTSDNQQKSKNFSTVFGSSLSDKKGSSLLFHGGIFQSSSIILKNGKHNQMQLKNIQNQCYILIDNVFFVRKSMDCIKVTSPHSEATLNCQPNFIPQIYYLSQGIPFDSFKQVGRGKIIQISESPIVTKLKLVCKNCQKLKKNSNQGDKNCPRQVKFTFSTSLIQPKELSCDQCHAIGDWRLVKLESNFPVWGNGNKIQQDDQLQELPTTIRVMGCINCLRYIDSQNLLPCGCCICKSCYAQRNYNKQCQICSSLYY